jgi:hypothetical protein
MVVFLPPIYQDELLYSIIARYSKVVDYSSQKHLLEDWFGRGKLCAIVDLPTRLNMVDQNTKIFDYWNTKSIISKHTMAPYFTAFASQTVTEKVHQAMRETGYPHSQLGLVATKIPLLKHLKYCPQCSFEDRQQRRETYWRRTHQAYGVLVCPIHHVWLEESNIACRPVVGKYVFFAAEDCIPTELKITPIQNNQVSTKLLSLAEQSAFLLNNPISYPAHQIRELYLTNLINLKAVTPLGKVRAGRLEEIIQSKIPTELTEILQLPFSPSGHPWWNKLIWESRKLTHTVFHFLIQQVLEISIESLNPAEVIHKVSGQKSSRIIDQSGSPTFIQRRELRRNDWQKLMAQYPEKSITQLKRVNNAVYLWLYKNDLSWLKLHQGKQAKRGGNKLRQNWESRDLQYVDLLNSAYQRLLALQHPRRITAGRLAREIGFDALIQVDKAKLPLSLELLANLSETPEKFKNRMAKI